MGGTCLRLPSLPLAFKWVNKSPPLRYSLTISRVPSLSITSSSSTVFRWFNTLKLYTSEYRYWRL